MRVKYFLKSVNVINVLLLAALGLVGWYTVYPFFQVDLQIKAPQAKAAAVAELLPAPSTSPSPVDYALISEQNLFHPERKIPPEKPDEKAVPRPEVVLYGTILMGDASVAFVEDKRSPHTTPGRGKRQTMLRKGENLSGYVLQEIEANRIVLAKGEDKIIVMLDDRQKKGEMDKGASPFVKAVPAGTTPVGVAAISPYPQLPALSGAAPVVPASTTPYNPARSRRSLLNYQR